MERLTVLTKHLKDDPLRLVADLSLSDDSYEVVFRTLDRNYATTASDVSRLLDRLRVLHRVHKPYDLPALLGLVVLVQWHITALDANGMPLSNYAASLQCSVKAAIPTRMRQEYLREKKLDRRLDAIAHDDGALSNHASIGADRSLQKKKSSDSSAFSKTEPGS